MTVKFMNGMFKAPFLVQIIVDLALTSWRRAPKDEWTRFRGPNGSGISAAVTVPAAWTAKDYNWKVKLRGIGHSSPVVWGERVFVTSGDPDTAKRFILCLHRADGRVLWQRELQRPKPSCTTGTTAMPRPRRRWTPQALS